MQGRGGRGGSWGGGREGGGSASGVMGDWGVWWAKLEIWFHIQTDLTLNLNLVTSKLHWLRHFISLIVYTAAVSTSLKK